MKTPQIRPLSQDELVARARREYGELIERITLWPDGSISVHLVGYEAEFCFPDGLRASTFEDVSILDTTRRALARLRGAARTITGKA